ncbi:MAG: SDR family oxidoreductase [Clostridia bacterium]|nr:SDR family oxidoreductase [Clostridia bacterium]
MKVVVTGASGDIGKAIVRAFFSRGDNVAILYFSDEASANALAAEGAAPGLLCVTKKADLRDAEDTSRALDELLRTFGAPDILVNAAGIDDYNTLLDTTTEKWDEIFAVNARSVFQTSVWAAKHMLAGGRIVNISSVWGRRPAPCEGAYAASKAAVESFTKTFAAEVGDLGVTVNAVAAGYIDTKMNARFSKEERADFLSSLAVKRVGTTEDVVNAVLFLADEKSSYITGQILEVSGGMH